MEFTREQLIRTYSKPESTKDRIVFTKDGIRKLLDYCHHRFMRDKLPKIIAEHKSEWLRVFVKCVKVMEAQERSWLDSPYKITIKGERK